MADVQKEHGHVDIANGIVEALAKTHLSSRESQILWAIFRKTYGWHKKEDWITGSQLVEMTGINKSHISETVKGLIQRKMVIKNGKKLGFQKDYDQWGKFPIGVTNKKFPLSDKKFPIGVTEVPDRGNKKFPIGVNTKETKETITKEIISSQIKNLLTLFPKIPIEEIQVYWDNAARTNKTGVITEGRKLTMLTELYNLMKRTNDINLFNYALESANRYGVANIGYVGAVIKNKITKEVE